MSWNIGNVEIKNCVALAPMAGISNPAYIKICEEMGVGYAVTELISAEAIVRGNKKTLEMLNGIDQLNIPVAVQIFGSNPDTMAKASRILVDLHQIRLIDINMGCPVKKLIQNHSGAMLMQDQDLACRLVEAVKKQTHLPVSIKTRLGWCDEKEILGFAPQLVAAGADRIEVHARTKEQGYTGKAHWSILKKLNIAVPIVVNGDIVNHQTALQALKESGAEAVMVGRALLGHPWRLTEIEQDKNIILKENGFIQYTNYYL